MRARAIRRGLIERLPSATFSARLLSGDRAREDTKLLGQKARRHHYEVLGAAARDASLSAARQELRALRSFSTWHGSKVGTTTAKWAALWE